MTDLHTSIYSLPHIPDDLTICQFMLHSAHPLRPARNGVPCLIEDKTGAHVTIEQLQDDTYALANALSATYHLHENDVVMISSPNHIDYIVALWSIFRVGAIASCSNPQFTADELGCQLRLSRASLVIAHSSTLETARSAARIAGIPTDRVILLDRPHSYPTQIPCIRDLIQDGLTQESVFIERDLEPGEGKTKVALLSWSSGTTGSPKAVAISHHGLIANVLQMAVQNKVGEASSSRESRGYRPGDVAIGVLPFYHVAGLVINLHLVLFCAMSVVIVPKYNILDMLESIVRHRVTHLLIVPPQAVDLCKHPAVRNHDLSMVRYVMIGAAPVAREVQDQLFELFPTAQIGQAYGLTEMTTTVAMISGSQKRGPLGSGGQLLPGIQARVIRADGSLAGYGEEGELIVKGPAAALGYLDNQQATSETFINGWVRTGDQVIISSAQEIFVVDRIKELLKVKGFQVAPAELEGCLLSHPDVIDCCVVGVPDDYSGELPRAYVVLSSDALQRTASSAAESSIIQNSIYKHVSDRKVSYKQLRGGVHFIPSIPKNGSGKILRRILRDMARDEMKVRARL
ncbi:hypothetical protein BDZ94DRAFT_303366 [Collybia nuda]|uniref:4-coumarate--CoA ligase n=1 Tax=Collybia nuda TaxID=64659 RepID=A0A9P6CMB5_9AGAR|nr:hypothetical protein BDZ94DRAFT_303366 [Collybia nuda]